MYWESDFDFARTDAEAADLLTPDVDDNDKPFVPEKEQLKAFIELSQDSNRRFLGVGLCSLCRFNLV